MPEVIKLNSSETAKDLVTRLKDSESRIIYVTVPAASRVLNVMSLRMLHRIEREIHKKIVMVSANPDVRTKIEQAGLTTTPEIPGMRSSRLGPVNGNRPKSSDIAAKEVAAFTSPRLKELNSYIRQSPADWMTKETANSQKVVSAPEQRRRRAWFFSASIAAAVLAAFLVANFVMPKAVITVYAHQVSKTFSLDFKANKLQTSTSTLEKVIPGIETQKDLSKSGQFPATGTVGSADKAKGTVLIRSSQPGSLILRAQTTYLEAQNGQRYDLVSDIRGLRPGVPYSAEVIAQTSGTAANIGADARLEVHNSAFGYRPEVLYATVGSAGLTGGGSGGGQKAVSQTDLDNALDSLKKQMIVDLNNSLGGETILPEGLVDFAITSIQTDGKVGEARDNFTYTLQAKVTALALKKSNLSELLASQAKSNASFIEQYVGLDLDSANYKVNAWDKATGIADIHVDYNASFYNKIDEQALKTLLTSRSTTEVKSLLIDNATIDDVKVNLSPFWLRKTPKSSGKIEIKVDVKR